MSGFATISAKNRELADGYVTIGGKWRKITDGWAVKNGVWQQIFSSGLPLANLPVGSLVKIIESGVGTNYRLVHQGLPSSVYDSSCNGTWLLREILLSDKVQWAVSQSSGYAYNIYESSNIHSYLNGTFLTKFNSSVQSLIKQVKIPYQKNGGKGGTVVTGSNGLSTKAFLLSMDEIGLPPVNYCNVIGARLSYFTSTATRIAYNSSGTATRWYTRSLHTQFTEGGYIWSVRPEGTLHSNQGNNYFSPSSATYHRPAFILPATALVNPTPNADGSYSLIA